MLPLPLSIANLEILECLLVNLPHILQSLGHGILSALHVNIYKCEGGVLETESEGDSSLVSGDTRESSPDFTFFDALYLFFMFFLYKHYDEAPDHHFLNNVNVLDPLSVHI